MPGDPFDFDVPPDAPLRRAAYIAVRPLLSRMLGLRTLSGMYRSLPPHSAMSFPGTALHALGVTAVDEGTIAAHVPARGPVVIVANHPHGALDGLVLLSLVGAVRTDVRLLANRLLARIPELRDSCFFVDPFEHADAAARSVSGLRAARRWLENGGALVAFPSGEVAHRWNEGMLVDSPWKSSVFSLALATDARIVPVFIAGRNRRVFYLSGQIHPGVRTALLPRELLANCHKPVQLLAGPPCHGSSVRNDVRHTIADVRASVEALAPVIAVRGELHQGAPRLGADARWTTGHARSSFPQGQTVVRDAAVSGVRSPEPDLCSAIAALPDSARLLSNGAFDVYCAERRQLQSLMGEIGRLREVAYRAAGEGTGRDCDLDRFDDHYLHLFTWNRERREVAGAYRIGRVDRIIASHGLDGLYTRTLFRYDRALIDRMAPALELGRSFVRLEYQRNHTALLLLWRGICRFVALHPQYRVLYGAVSISARYSDMSQQLLMRFLEQNHRYEDAAVLVSGMHPPQRQLRPSSAVSSAISVDGLDALVARMEVDRKGLPVLLRQYLKLNARLLGFSVDPAFGDALDALMMVDLSCVEPAILRRYFGPEDAARYLARGQAVQATSAA